MSENINTKVNKQIQKQIRKMKKYIRTFPLKSEEIILIHKDIDGMAEEAKGRGESLENVLGKSPREFCDELIYAVGGMKTPGGRTILRFVGKWYKTLAFLGIFGAIFALLTMFIVLLEDLMVKNPDILGDVEFFMSGILESVVSGIVYYIAGERALLYSSDVKVADKAMKWGVGMFLFELASVVLLNIPVTGKVEIIIIIFSFIFGCFPSVLFIIGAIRNRPHKEA